MLSPFLITTNYSTDMFKSHSFTQQRDILPFGVNNIKLLTW